VARKPGSVPRRGCPGRGGDHSSRTGLAAGLQQPYPGTSGGPPVPCSVLLQVGFTDARVATDARGLLPHGFTLTLRRPPEDRRALKGGLVSVALSLGSPPLGVTQHPALRSPDFPPANAHRRPPAAARATSTEVELYHACGGAALLQDLERGLFHDLTLQLVKGPSTPGQNRSG